MMKRPRMMITLCSLSVILISGAAGLLSMHDQKAAVGPSTGVMVENIQNPVPTQEVLPADQDKPNLNPNNEKQLPENKMPLQGLFETSQVTVKSESKLGINFSLKNISGKDLQISHSSGQRYDIVVYNERHEEVYRWSLNKAFTQALIVRDLKQAGEMDFHEEWNLQDNKGSPVPAGEYTIEVNIMVGLESGTIRSDELTASTTLKLD